MRKVEIPDGHTPWTYSTRYLLHKTQVGDILTLEFGAKSYRVKRDYLGKTIDFVVVNFTPRLVHSRSTKKLALVAIEKKGNFKDSDVLLLSETEYVKCLVVNLFPCNRRPYAGWKNKIVTVIEVK